MQTQTLSGPTFTNDLSKLMNVLSNFGMNGGHSVLKSTLQDLTKEFLSSDTFAAMSKETKRHTIQEMNDLAFILQELDSFSEKYNGEIDLENVKGRLRIYSEKAPASVFCNPEPVGVVTP